MKAQDMNIKTNGSVRLKQGANSGKNSSQAAGGKKPTRPSISDASESDKTQDTRSLQSRPSVDSSDQRPNAKKFLSKMKADDLKFIDTSVDSDLPPTLSQLQRKSVQISIDDRSPPSPTIILSFDSEVANSISGQITQLNEPGGLAVPNVKRRCSQFDNLLSNFSHFRPTKTRRTTTSARVRRLPALVSRLKVTRRFCTSNFPQFSVFP